MKIFIFLFLMAPAFGLRISERNPYQYDSINTEAAGWEFEFIDPNEKLQRSDEELDRIMNEVGPSLEARFQKHECDQSINMVIVREIVGSVKTFFAKKNITIYPTLLTMVGALRWGGISLKAQNDRQRVLDYDLDFMIVTPPGMSQTEKEHLTKEYLRYAEAKFRVVAFDIVGYLKGYLNSGPQNMQWLREWVPKDSGLLISVDGDYEQSLVSLLIPSPIGKVFYDQTTLFLSRRYTKKFKIAPNKSATREIEQTVKHLFKPFRNGMNFQHMNTAVNFWFSPQQDRRFGISSTKKTMLLGHDFPFPENQDAISMPLQGDFVEGHKAKTAKFCDFAVPSGLFEEDFPSTEKIKAATQACTKNLQDFGFESFSTLCGSSN